MIIFIGERYDNTTGLNYLNARYYDGEQGQFLSQDPMFWKFYRDKEIYNKLITDPQQWNSYSYSRNNPIVSKDPNGESLVNALFFGRYSIEQDQQDLGQAVDYLYNTSSTWKTALDNPVATGVTVAVGGGLAVGVASCFRRQSFA